jgi:2-hydroxy-6-oxonona-2,4-dienedioate hydrolase
VITAEQYRSIRAPTLVVWTSHDPTATPEEGKQIADMIPGSKFVVMNRCGHWPQFKDANQFMSQYLYRLAQTPLPVRNQSPSRTAR